MTPLRRNIVIGLVGFIMAGALAALGLAGENPDASILMLVVAALIAAGVAIFLYWQGWQWGTRLARRHETGSSVLAAIGGGLMALVAAAALGGLAILILLFYLG